MIRLLAAAVTATTIAAGIAAPALALSPSEQSCLDQGGVPDRTQGTVTCTFTEEGKNSKFTEETTTSGQGNIGNKTQQSTDCDPTGSDKCPPGQF